jgi:hypothetical protein
LIAGHVRVRHVRVAGRVGVRHVGVRHVAVRGHVHVAAPADRHLLGHAKVLLNGRQSFGGESFQVGVFALVCLVLEQLHGFLMIFDT